MINKHEAKTNKGDKCRRYVYLVISFSTAIIGRRNDEGAFVDVCDE